MSASAPPPAPVVVDWTWSRKPHTPIEPPPHPTYSIVSAVQNALAEDAGGLGDVTTQATVAPDTQAEGTFLAKSPGCIAGLAVVDLTFQLVEPQCQVTWLVADGDQVEAGTRLGRVVGSAASILVAERVALNFMQRMSGIATATAAMVKAVSGTRCRVLETRKTVPGLRLLDKWAVLIGGGDNHRMGLYDMMMIKDNHVTAAGGVAAAIAAAEKFITEQGLKDMRVEVETRTLAEVDEALAVLKSGAAPHVSRLMLDNMTRRDASQPGGVDVSLLAEAVKRIDGVIDTEASGNVMLETAGPIAATGVTHVSVGSLTHSVTAMDISLKIVLVPVAK